MRSLFVALFFLVVKVRAQATEPPTFMTQMSGRRNLGESCCELGSPTELTFIYTGDGCLAAEDNQQIGDSCVGSISPASPPERVFILASSREDPCDSQAQVWFEDERSLENAEFTLITDEASFPHEIFIHIFPVDSLCDAERLETIRLVSDCSTGEDLSIGSIFGSVEIGGCFSVETDQGEDCCEFLDDEPLQLRFTYTGDTVVKVIANDRADACDSHRVWYTADDIQPQDEFTLDVRNAVGEKNFGSTVFIHLLSPHGACDSTSAAETFEVDICSRNPTTQLLNGNGLIIGDVVPRTGKTVLIGCSAEAPSEKTSCCQPSKNLASLHFTYTGDNCLAESGAFVKSCTGELNNIKALKVIASRSKDVCDKYADVFFDGKVNLGEEFVLSAQKIAQREIHGDIWLHYVPLHFDRTSADCNNDRVLQSVEMHISCADVDITTESFFGGATLDKCLPASQGNCCAEEAPLFLTFELSPRLCDASNNGQSNDDCSGSVSEEEEVYIIANGDENVCHKGDWKGPVWFEGFTNMSLSSKEHIILSVANEFGQTNFGDETYLHILKKEASCVGSTLKDSAQLLQKIKIQTSCKKEEPLFVGDTFASAVLIDCSADFDDDCCEENSKLKQITFEYVPRNCSAFGNEQTHYSASVDSVCTDFVDNSNLNDDVYVIASDQDEPCESTARRWFSDVVSFSANSREFTVRTESSLSSSTYIHILSKTDTPCADGQLAPGVHQVQKLFFDAHCEQPFKIGNFFGSAEVVDCKSTDRHDVLPTLPTAISRSS